MLSLILSWKDIEKDREAHRREREKSLLLADNLFILLFTTRVHQRVEKLIKQVSGIASAGYFERAACIHGKS